MDVCSDDTSSVDDNIIEERNNYSFMPSSAELNMGDSSEDPQDNLEILANYASSSNKWWREAALKNLYCFVCTLAMEGLTVDCNRIHSKELWFLAHGNFSNVLELYPMKDQAKRTLKYFDNETWPHNFKSYCITKHQDETKVVPKKWQEKYKNELRGVSAVAMKQLYNGHCIHKCANEIKRVINTELNPLWNISKVPSGFTTKHLVNAIRKHMWPQECLTIATRAVTTGTKRKLKDGTFSITLTEGFTFDMALEEAYNKKLTSCFLYWYPPYWYTFVAIGYPSGDCSPWLTGGCPTATALGSGPSCALREGGKGAPRQQQRKMMPAQDKVFSDKNDVDESTSSGNKRQRIVPNTPSICSANGRYDTPSDVLTNVRVQHFKISSLEKTIELAIKLGKPKQLIDELSEKLFNLLSATNDIFEDTKTTENCVVDIGDNLDFDGECM